MSGWNSPWQLFPYFIAILFLLDVSAVLLNGLIAYVLKKYKKTTIASFWFIYCLSISDVMVGVSGLLCHLILLKIFLSPSATFWKSLKTAAFASQDYFLTASGRLVFIIAIDRCIHMKHLNKYSIIMTRSKTRWIMLFNVIFGVLIITPIFTASTEFNNSFYFGLAVFHTTCILFIYIIYIRIYFSIKRQTAALQIGRNTAVQNQPENRFAGEKISLNDQRCSGCLNAKQCVTISSGMEPNRFKSRILTTDDNIPEPQETFAVLSNYAATKPTRLCGRSEKPDEKRSTANLSRFVQNATTTPFGETGAGSRKVMVACQIAKTQNLDGKVIQQSQARRGTAEQEFRKATLFIFLALFICYFPHFIQSYYTFAAKAGNSLLSYLEAISLLLNCSLNAIILIVFSKEIRRKIKAIFV